MATEQFRVPFSVKRVTGSPQYTGATATSYLAPRAVEIAFRHLRKPLLEYVPEQVAEWLDPHVYLEP